MEIKDYVKQFRDLQKSHKKVRVADFCRENMLDYYEHPNIKFSGH